MFSFANNRFLMNLCVCLCLFSLPLLSFAAALNNPLTNDLVIDGNTGTCAKPTSGAACACTAKKVGDCGMDVTSSGNGMCANCECGCDNTTRDGVLTATPSALGAGCQLSNVAPKLTFDCIKCHGMYGCA